MRRKVLYKACVFLSVIGLTLMYASSLYMGIEKVDIGEIDRTWTGKNVRISGEVVELGSSGDIKFIDIQDPTGTILLVDFDSTVDIQEGDRINATGHVSVYEGELEVIAQEIET